MREIDLIAKSDGIIRSFVVDKMLYGTALAAPLISLRHSSTEQCGLVDMNNPEALQSACSSILGCHRGSAAELTEVFDACSAQSFM